jgi:hypothetical protein
MRIKCREKEIMPVHRHTFDGGSIVTIDTGRNIGKIILPKMKEAEKAREA